MSHQMTRRRFLVNSCLSLALPGYVTALAGIKSNRSRPNIIFIMADDHAAHAIGAYGSKINATPNIDRLAREGMLFTLCLNVNSLCAPSRAALVTGKYSRKNGFYRNGDRFDRTQQTFPRLLQKAGYETALIGKWHLVTEPAGFDYYNVLPGQGRFFNCPLKEKGKPWQDGNKGGEVRSGYLTDVITDLSIEWIKKRGRDKPFCLMVHHKAPHTPHQYPKKYAALYMDRDLPEPDTFNDDFATRTDALAQTRGRWSKLDNILPSHFVEQVPPKLEGDKFKKWAYQSFFKNYLRVVTALDDNIGRLLDYLDQAKLTDNTIVVYTSDNGFFLGDHGLFNKMWIYEESLRLPFLVRYPREIPAGKVNNELASILDFAPTFLDYAGSPIPENLQGRSLRPLLQGRLPDDWRTAHYYHYFGQYDVPPHNGIRTKRYKLAHFYELESERRWELYDMKTDPQELTNIIDKSEVRSVVETLKLELFQLSKKYEGDVT